MAKVKKTRKGSIWTETRNGRTYMKKKGKKKVKK